MGTTSHPRIIVTISEGLIESVQCDNFPEAVGVQLIMLDNDTEGADDDQLTDVGGDEMFFSVAEVTQADDQTSRNVASAYDNWSLS